MYNHHSDQDFLASAPSQLTAWLQEEGSLTDRLNQITHAAQLHVVQQAWIRAGWWEKYVLHCENSQFWQREIIMQSQSHICWYAKTLVEESVFLRHSDFFRKVEQASLNQLLFREYKARRQNKIYGCFTHETMEFHWVRKAVRSLGLPDQLVRLNDDMLLWGRRSCFAIDAQSSFYLLEVFLPGLLDAINS